MREILPASFCADFISRVFYPEEWKYGLLASINTGRCYDWAYKAFCLWSDTELWTTERHAWIRHGDRFFDSQSPEGVTDCGLLRCNEYWGWSQDPCAMSSEDFKVFWNGNGGGRRYHWKDLIAAIEARGLTAIRT